MEPTIVGKVKEKVKYVFIDTCIYVRCCMLEVEEKEFIEKVLNDLKSKLDSDEFILLLPEVVELEFPKSLLNALKDIEETAKGLKDKIIGFKPDKKHNRLQLNNIVTKTSLHVDSVIKEIEQNKLKTKETIESLFAHKNVQRILIEPDFIVEAYKYYIKGVKPVNTDNGGGIQSDCVIIASLKDFFDRKTDYQLYFCSSNPKDFAQSNDVSPQKIHEDIEKLFDDIKYSNNLTELLNEFDANKYNSEEIEKFKKEFPIEVTDTGYEEQVGLGGTTIFVGAITGEASSDSK